MCTILKEHRYVAHIRDQKHFLRIEELISGKAIWRAKFRLQIPADMNREAATIYGASPEEVAKLAADLLSRTGSGS